MDKDVEEFIEDLHAVLAGEEVASDEEGENLGETRIHKFDEEEFEKERIKVGYFDRCGWFSVAIEGEKRRIVIPKGKAEEASEVLDVILGKRE